MRLPRRIDGERSCDGRQHLLDLGGEDRLHLGLGNLPVVTAGGKPVGDRGRGGEAEVGLQERLGEFVEGRVVQLPLGENRRDAFGQRVR